MKLMSIGAFAKACGVSTRTIQRYVADKKIQPVGHSEGGHMRFGKHQIEEFNATWRDPRGTPRGFKRGRASTTRTGTTRAADRQSASRFVRETALKRKIVSQNSSSTGAKSEMHGLEDLM